MLPNSRPSQIRRLLFSRGLLAAGFLTCLAAIAAPVYASSDDPGTHLDASSPVIDARPAVNKESAVLSAETPSGDVETAGLGNKPASAVEAETAAAADPRIAAAIATIDPVRIQAIETHLVSFGNRNTLSSMATDLPPGQGINAAADWIESQFKEISAGCGGCLEVKRDTFTETPQSRIPQPTRISNIYAILRGTDPAQAARMYLVTGHYDSRASDTLDVHTAAPGANDDASGVSVSLESARALSKLKLPATLVFVAVAGEEQGLNGSRHLAQLAKSEGWQLQGVLNNDIVGGNTTPGDTMQDKSTVRVFSEGVPPTDTPEQVRQIEQLGYESDSPSRELARAVASVGTTYFRGTLADPSRGDAGSPFHPTLIFRADRFLRGGDHTSFNREGFTAVRFTEWREDFNHQHQDPRMENGVQFGDLLKYVDFNYIANVARLNAATLATLASAPPPPVEVKIITKNLDNDTTLTWQPGPGAPADAQYRIVWRSTGSPMWQFAAAVGQVTAATLPVSKDNVIVGIEASDEAGHRSVAVPPLPAR
jgi:hypothetical protein